MRYGALHLHIVDIKQKLKVFQRPAKNKKFSTKQEESLMRWDHGFTGDKVKVSV